MINKWRNYALKDGKIKGSYIREYSNRKKIRKTGASSNCNSLQQSWQNQEEVKLVYREPTHYKAKIDPSILTDAWVINLSKKERKNNG